jgi:Lamin Tail Domain
MSRAALAAAITAAVLVAGLAACGSDASATCKATLLPGDLVITEIFADYAAPSGSSGADTGKEWFEIYNASAAPVDLDGLVLTLSHADGTMPKSHTMTAQVLQPGAYLVLGDVDPALLPPWVGYGYGGDLAEMNNSSGGKLALSCNNDEIDHAVFAEVKSGFSQSFDGGTAPDYTVNDDLGHWCTSDAAGSTEFDPMNFGTPGAANQGCMVVVMGQCNDGGGMRATVPPGPGDLVITEVMPSPTKVSTTGEWFEVLATKDVDLNGLGLDRAGDTSKPDLVAGTDCIHLTAGQYAVFAKSSDGVMNGGLPPVAGTFKFAMVAGSATKPGDVQILNGTTVVDAVSWTKSASGKSKALDPDFATADGNDVETNWCDGATPYGAGDLGTPGAVNAQCAVVVPPGKCNDNGTLRDLVVPTAGQIEISEWMPDPSKVADASGEWVEIHAKAAFDLNGLQLGTTALVATPVVTSGDCVPIAADGYALFAKSSDPTTNGGLTTTDGKLPISLVNSNGTLTVGYANTILQTLTWATAKSGSSIQVDAAAKQCNAPTGTAAYNGTDLGTPRAAPTAACP